MADSDPIDLEVMLQTLNFATRLLAAVQDTEPLIGRALDALCDFGESPRAALLTVNEDGQAVEVAGALSRGGLIDPDCEIALESSPLAEVIRSRQPETFPLRKDTAMPLPAYDGDAATGECLCLPLIGSHNHILAVATLERPAGGSLSGPAMQVLNVITTLIAVSIENARLFRLATVDGLTGLYVRRFFEIRLEEEVARLRRHGGKLALLISDIDHFKQFNDNYGHQTGDMVLREMAALLRTSVRYGVDVPCRYGGEEFCAILPNTHLQGAAEVAERIRRTCERHPFPGDALPLRVTVSVGVAAMDGEHPLSSSELVKRADAALYRAKESGRNQVRAWEEE